MTNPELIDNGNRIMDETDQAIERSKKFVNWMFLVNYLKGRHIPSNFLRLKCLMKHNGVNVRLRYVLKVTISRGYAGSIVEYQDFDVISLLGMKDSWGPLKALAVASAVNSNSGDIVLCTFLGYDIAGAAWATMVSQVIAGYMMIEALNKKGYNAFAISVPSPTELLQIFIIAAPVFVTMTSKVAFYSLIVYFATSMGTHIVAAHQVVMQLYGMCTMFGGPLCQTAQSFMPRLMYRVNRSPAEARRLSKSMVIIGALSGLILGSIGTFVPLMFPNFFSPDPEVIGEMDKVLIPYLPALCVTHCVHSLEGTLLGQAPGQIYKPITVSQERSRPSPSEICMEQPSFGKSAYVSHA